MPLLYTLAPQEQTGPASVPILPPGAVWSAAAVVIVVAAVAAAVSTVVVAAAVAQQQDQNDDPPPVVAAEAVADPTVVIAAHKNYLRELDLSFSAQPILFRTAKNVQYPACAFAQTGYDGFTVPAGRPPERSCLQSFCP